MNNKEECLYLTGFAIICSNCMTQHDQGKVCEHYSNRYNIPTNIILRESDSRIFREVLIYPDGRLEYIDEIGV